MTTEWGVYVRDRNRRLTASLDGWTSLQLSLRYRDVGSWQITAPVTATARLLATAGNGVIFRRNGVTLMSGLTTSYTEEWSEQAQGAGTLVISGRDDLIDLGRMLAEPDPLVAGTPTQDYDNITGPAETVIRSYVSRNAGITARTGRVRHTLGQTANLAAGATVTGNARYDNLLDLCRTLAVAGGVGFRALQDTGGVAPLFDVFVPVDRSATVVFSRGAGNLAAYSYSITAPAATKALVAGQGEGAARTVVAVSSSVLQEDWDTVVEVFIDRRDTNDSGELTQEGEAVLADGSATAGLSVTPIDLPSMTYGVHYGLGDIVSVDVDATTRVTDVLSAVTISASPEQGETLSPVVGTGDTAETPALYATLRKLGSRVGLLERRV